MLLFIIVYYYLVISRNEQTLIYSAGAINHVLTNEDDTNVVVQRVKPNNFQNRKQNLILVEQCWNHRQKRHKGDGGGTRGCGAQQYRSITFILSYTHYMNEFVGKPGSLPLVVIHSFYQEMFNTMLLFLLFNFTKI